ncbi:methyl-accepting chemotaxis protein [Vibrio variabilis]|uniref:Methyl-accepting chemotaxis protein n=1 Tax=Vibrio variabilis TaxID=990271 RepID=A0ABQ0JIR2_9VIBR|nr:methyl-accepting chemotaxis protein [Vibrio variabilis]
MNLSLRQKLIAATLSAVVLMAVALTILAANQLSSQTNAAINARATMFLMLQWKALKTG